MAPELGLFLDECVFKSYNDRWGNDREAQVSLSDFQEQVDAFKASCAVHSCLLGLKAVDAVALLMSRRFKSPSVSRPHNAANL